jgi:hypothetical protein
MIVGTRTVLAILGPVTVTIHLGDVSVVGKPIEQRAGQAFTGEHADRLIEGRIPGDDDLTEIVAQE